MVFHTAFFWLRSSLHSKWKWSVARRSLILPYSPSSWSSWFDRVTEWPFEDSVTVPARCRAEARLSRRLHMVWIWQPRFTNPGTEVWIGEWHHPLLPLGTPNKIFASCHCDLCSPGLEVFISFLYLFFGCTHVACVLLVPQPGIEASTLH